MKYLYFISDFDYYMISDNIKDMFYFYMSITMFVFRNINLCYRNFLTNIKKGYIILDNTKNRFYIINLDKLSNIFIELNKINEIYEKVN